MPNTRGREGFWFALTAYLTWGIAPIYFKWLETVAATEIIAHRITWSVILLLLVLFLTGKLFQLRQLLSKWPWLVITALLISANWLIFVWAITHERISETSLGYYINPLVSVVLAGIFLGERLRPLQWLAFIVAGIGVGVRLLHYGQLPWVALCLAVSFGFYGLLRKKIDAPAVAGLAFETILLLPFAVAYLVWLSVNDQLAFAEQSLTIDALLLAAGVVTTIPLLCFAAAVVRLNLSTIGIMQYIAPTLSLILAVVIYGEPFNPSDVLSFACIWVALGVFTFDNYRFARVYRITQANKVTQESA